MNKYEKMSIDLSNWLRSTVLDTGAKGVVLGLSGGVDSAVVAGISKLAFPDNTLCLMMPCHSSPKDIEDGNLVADALNLKTEIVDLSSTYDQLLNSSNIKGTELSYQNIKPRLRSTTMYYYAQTLGYLTLGGTNLSEYYIGYFTKYGDNSVDILPIAHLTKKNVYELAKALGVPQRIIDKKPSAGLTPGQTDEEDLGFTYSYLDNKIENGNWDIYNPIDNKIINMHRNSEHKRKKAIIFEGAK